MGAPGTGAPGTGAGKGESRDVEQTSRVHVLPIPTFCRRPYTSGFIMKIIDVGAAGAGRSPPTNFGGGESIVPPPRIGKKIFCCC